MQTIGKQEQNIFFLHACRIQLIYNQTNRYFSVGGRLAAALYNIRNYDNDFASLMSQLGKRFHSHRIAYGFPCFGYDLILRDTGRIWNGLSRNKYIGSIRKLCCHCAMAIFKIKFHTSLLTFPDTV